MPNEEKTYFQAVNAFKAIGFTEPFKPNEAALFFALLDAWNGARRPMEFCCWSSTITRLVGLSEKAQYRARRGLIERGVMFYKKPSNRSKPTYDFSPLFSDLPDNLPDIGAGKEDLPDSLPDNLPDTREGKSENLHLIYPPVCPVNNLPDILPDILPDNLPATYRTPGSVLTSTSIKNKDKDNAAAPDAKAAASIFLSLYEFSEAGKKLGIPETYSENLYREIEANNFRDKSGKPIASPSRFLSYNWQRATEGTGGDKKRQAWQIQKDIDSAEKLISAEKNKLERFQDREIMKKAKAAKETLKNELLEALL